MAGGRNHFGNLPSSVTYCVHDHVEFGIECGRGRRGQRGRPDRFIARVFFTGDFLPVIFLPVIFFAGVGLFGAFLIVTHRNLPTLSALHSVQAVPESP